MISFLKCFLQAPILNQSKLVSSKLKLTFIKWQLVSIELCVFQIAGAVWLYYITKFFELLDTVFFMLRKKDKQLSFLHVYHHSTMFVFSWIGTKYVPGGSAFLPIIINSSVHICMYLYYTLAALKCTKVFKYKKYITIIQLVKK